MAGNTGKMTSEEIEARGPRLQLLSVVNPFIAKGRRYVIAREGQFPITPKLDRIYSRVYATSYSLSYLMRIVKTVIIGANQ